MKVKDLIDDADLDAVVPADLVAICGSRGAADYPTCRPAGACCPMPDLADRVKQFNTLQLPGQPMGMHMGTSYLVNDLWREVERLRDVLDTTHKLVTEGALVGFIATEGTWAERLYANQGQIHHALNARLDASK